MPSKLLIVQISYFFDGHLMPWQVMSFFGMDTADAVSLPCSGPGEGSLAAGTPLLCNSRLRLE